MSWKVGVVTLAFTLLSGGLAAQEAARPEPLRSGSLGVTSPPPRAVIPPGSYDLSVDGDFELGGFVFKDGRPFLHNDGGAYASNTALGLDALISSTPGVPYFFSGSYNTAIGASALESNTSGLANTATGAFALFYSTTGFGNTANGYGALFENTTGNDNTATGEGALSHNTTGSGNTANGDVALYRNDTGGKNTATGRFALFNNTSGERNTAAGVKAGYNGVSGSDNIWIASYGADESNTLRIGEGTGNG